MFLMEFFLLFLAGCFYGLYDASGMFAMKFFAIFFAVMAVMFFLVGLSVCLTGKGDDE